MLKKLLLATILEAFTVIVIGSVSFSMGSFVPRFVARNAKTSMGKFPAGAFALKLAGSPVKISNLTGELNSPSGN